MIKKFENLLKDADLRITPQRLIVLEILSGMKTHPSMDEIIKIVQSKNSHISVGTIYRIVDQFLEAGLIRKLKTQTGSMRIDPEVRHHHHLINDDETRVEDYHDSELDILLKDYFAKKGIKDFSIEQISVEIKGKFEK